ncbi:MAG: biotin/lipoyl-containing protein [Promethearchaeota archaeon]
MGNPKKKVSYHGREFIIEPLDDDHININGYVFSPQVVQHTEDRFRVTIGKYHFVLENIDGKLYLEGEEVDINIKPYIEHIGSNSQSSEPSKASVKAPIPGKILQILVSPLEMVEKDQEILILEAMKMRNRILAPISGKIAEIFITVGDNVAQDQVLLQIVKD